MLASTPVIALDASGRIDFLTPRAAALLGVDPGQVRGIALPALLAESDLPSHRHPTDLDAAIWTGRRPDGSDFAFALAVAPVASTAGSARFVATLSPLVGDQVAEQARELGDRLNRVWRLNSLGEMAACLAHELNQPLGAATNYLHAARSDLHRAGPAAAETVRALDLAKTQLLRAGAIIRRMRELLNHESRGLGAENVQAMIGDMEGVLAMIGQSEGVRIDIELSRDDDHVLAERIQIQQAIINLVRNAVEAVAGTPGARVVIRGRILGAAAYELSVEDNGPGIAPADLDRVLRPLTTTKDGGMGLGLSVTRTIVESHGGDLSVRTSDLGGAAVCFNLMRDGGSGEA